MGATGTFGTEFTRTNALQCVLNGGDDYELVFTAPKAQAAAVQAAAAQIGVPVTCIGHIEAASGVRLMDGQGVTVPADYRSFDHFAAQG